ncbi:MAG TPA: protein kinase [Gemmatimonadales bacterium]|nr:protein kinase [Gemmatimonadales bacterium]
MPPSDVRDDLAVLERALGERYALERELGRGGMASVWLARDRRHDRPVAIKVLHPELASAIGIDRFLREVRLTAGLQHPHIVPLLDSGTVALPGGLTVPWYAMAYVQGESLRARLQREHQLPVDEALAIAEQAADALAFAHGQGVVHRDVKPENILLAGGQAYVCDFGIAKALSDTGGERLTSTGLAIGTPAYMSPEQATASTVDARSDQYSLASVLYEMLAGEPPFTGATAQMIVTRRLGEPARALRPVRPAVPEGLERAVLRSLERVPADRFPDMTGFTAALRAEARAPAPRVAGRRVAGLALVAVLALGTAIGAWQWTRNARAGTAVVRDTVAVALYRRGLRHYDQRTPAGVATAIADFSAALARDSTYAAAWNGLARACVRAFQRRFLVPGMSVDSVLRLAVAAGDRALALDGGSADTWITQGQVSQSVDPTDPAPIVRAARRAVQLDSASAPAWHALAIAQADSGDLAAGVRTWRRCTEVDPAYTQCLTFLAWGLFWQHRYDEAARWADSAVSVDPTYLTARTVAGFARLELGDGERASAALGAMRRLGADVETVNALAGSVIVEAALGRTAAARAMLQQAESLSVRYEPAALHTAAYMAQAHAAVGDTEAALRWIERYTPTRDLHFQVHLRCDARFAPLAREPRFRALLARPRPEAGC